MLAVEKLLFWRGKNPVLDGISFDLPGAGIVPLMGYNGAGKTTLLKILSGNLIPDSGSISWDSQPWFKSWEVPVQIGYLPENFAPPQCLTSRQYLGFTRQFNQASVEQSTFLIQELGLEEQLDRPIGKLSKGFCQRLGLAQAFMGNKQLILLDEPINGFDLAAQECFWNLLDSRKSDTLILFSTHYLEGIQGRCTHVLLLQNHVLHVLTPEEIISRFAKSSGQVFFEENLL